MTSVRGAGAPMAMLKRVTTAVVFIPLFAWLVVRGPDWLYTAFVVALSALAQWELSRLFERAGQPVYTRLGLVLGMALTASFAAPTPTIVPALPVVVLCVAVGALLAAPLASAGPLATEPVALTLLGLMYVSWFLGHALPLRGLPAGAALVLFLVGVTWLGESAAYLVGSAVGRHKLAPTISPNKTIEGALAQLVASLLGALGLAAWLLPQWPAPRALGAGAVLGVLGQVGDLAESAMKRSVGVKDTGGLVPGHGGLLDRMDSLLFNAPAFYYYVRLGGGA